MNKIFPTQRRGKRKPIPIIDDDGNDEDLDDDAECMKIIRDLK